MALRFSQRMGLVSGNTTLQINSIDDGLKNRLWNMVMAFFENGDILDERKWTLLWISFFKLPIDQIPKFLGIANKEIIMRDLRKWYFENEWFCVYDIIEFISTKYSNLDGYGDFIRICNKILEEEGAGYRIMDKLVVPITSDVEISEIENAMIYGESYRA